METKRKDDAVDVDPYAVYEVSEDDEEGPGLGVWVSVAIWLGMIAIATWAYFIYRNTHA